MNRLALLCRTRTLAVVSLLAAGAAHANTVEGVWWSTVTRVDCNTGAEIFSFAGLQVYHRGGTLTDTNSSNPATRGPGMGTWKRVGQDVQTRFRFMLFSNGVFNGTVVVTRDFTMTPGTDTAVGTGRSEVYDPAGTLVATSCTRDVSTRAD